MLMLVTSASYADRSTDEDAWKHSITLYGWLPTIDGKLKYDLGGDSETEVDAGEILDSLEAVFMGSFETRKNKWMFLADVLYIDLEDSSNSSIPLPGGGALATNIELGLEGVKVGLYVGYNFYQAGKTSVDLIGGLRYLSIDTDAELKTAGPLPPTLPTAKLSRDTDIWDGIIGLRGRTDINEKWYIPFHVDAGAGDSDLTWQTQVGIGYQAGWGDTILFYRHLEWDEGSDELVQNLSFSGPGVGVKFHF